MKTFSGSARRAGSSRRLVAVAAAGLAVATLLSGCGDDEPREPEARQVAAPAPPPGPAAGACYQLPYEEAVAPTVDATAVPCTTAHTAETVAVGALDAVKNGHLVAVDSEHVQQQVASACPQALSEFLGGSKKSLRLSMIRPVWFTPTVQQSDAGESWYRCDAVLLAGTASLAELTTSLKGSLASGVPKKYAMCGTAAPDAKNFERVLCSAKHSWRAIDVVVFDKEDEYPGLKKVRSAGRRQCEDAAADIAEDPLVFAWGYEWPTEEQWDMGQKFGRCWAPEPKKS